VAQKATGLVSSLGIPGVSTIAGIANKGLSTLTGGGAGATDINTIMQRIQTNQPLTAAQKSAFQSATGTSVEVYRQNRSSIGVALPSFGPNLPAMQTQTAVSRYQMPAGPPPAPGYHPNKSGYYRQAVPGDPTSAVYIPPRSMWVKNRRRNPANARATDRAISRIGQAKRYASKLGRITIRKAS